MGGEGVGHRTFLPVHHPDFPPDVEEEEKDEGLKKRIAVGLRRTMLSDGQKFDIYPEMYEPEDDSDSESDELEVEKEFKKLKLNNSDIHVDKEATESWMDQIKCWVAQSWDPRIISPEVKDYIVKLLEDLGLFALQLVNSNGKIDITIAIVTFVKLRTKGALLSNLDFKLLYKKFKKIFGMEIQSNCFGTMRDLLTNFAGFCESEIFKKLHTFLMFCMSLSLFDFAGISFHSLYYSKVEREYYKKFFRPGKDMFITIMDTILFILEKGLMCIQSGTLEPIYHSETTYTKWYDDSIKVIRDSEFLNNPEAHNMDYHEFLTKMDDCIEKGRAIVKYSTKGKKSQLAVAQKVLDDLNMIRENHLTKKGSMSDRKSPLAILINGGSSIAKSTITNILFMHYGKVMNKNTDSEMKYTRNPVDKFWTNFRSYQWCVVLDDIAFMNPNAAPQGDASVLEILQVINNVAFVPTQADLSDKGNTPLRAELVLATTNCSDLNAQAYFACPLAARRRFPYMITAYVKGEYCKTIDNITYNMLDPTKVPPAADNSYPDYWNFVIERVVPAGNTRALAGQAKFQHVRTVVNMRDLISWYNIVIKEHAVNQSKVEACVATIRNSQMCRCCDLPQTMCRNVQVQGYIVLKTNWDVFWRIVGVNMISNFLCMSISTGCLAFLFPYLWRRLQHYFLDKALSTAAGRIAVAGLGLDNEKLLNWTEKAAKAIALVTALSITYVATKKVVSIFESINESTVKEKPLMYPVMREDTPLEWSTEPTKPISKEQAAINNNNNVVVFEKTKITSTSNEPITSKFEVQAHDSAVVIDELESNIDDFPRDEVVNTWYNEEPVLSTFDVSTLSSSYNGLPEEEVNKIILSNTICTLAHYSENGQKLKQAGKAFCVGGNWYMMNNHTLPAGEDVTLDLISSTKKGISENITIKVCSSRVYRLPNKDVAFINIKNLPPKKDLRGLFASKAMSGSFNGKYIIREESGILKTKVMKCIRKSKDFACPLGIFDCWSGICDTETEKGECGGLLIANSDRGPIILGIHTLYDYGAAKAYSTAVYTEDIDSIVKDKIVIQSSAPLLVSPGIEKEVAPLHPKSTFRYFEEGTGKIHGSLTGFRASYKSDVKPTILAKKVSEYGYVSTHGPPVMKGWEVWRNNISPMINQNFKIDYNILDKAAKSFANDIIHLLPAVELAAIRVMSYAVAVNGVDGVRFLDRMKRNTSAGFPWRKSKKFLMYKLGKTKDCAEAEDFIDEVKLRVNIILDKYKRGELFHPIFTMQLKDEAITKKKIDEKRTRAFAGCPVDWGIVVRMLTLGFVRVFQRNKFIFEGAPGTATQSVEWGDILKYLKQHPLKNGIAGDFKNYDKLMVAEVMLAAFDVIIIVCKAAGYSELALRMLQCLAFDIAFPLYDANGDLITCFGAMPSGHPLTVIINCIANSIFNRYVYIIVNPAHTCADFKQNVALMVYGDDNISTVSDAAPWFNHTALSLELGKLGMIYTMADKISESVPYINILEQGNFLKRTWRYDKEVGSYLCPLDHTSIVKMLCMGVKSKAVTEEDLAVSLIGTALREYFFYGREVFETKKNMFTQIIIDMELSPYCEASTLPSWEDLYMTYWENSKHCYRLTSDLLSAIRGVSYNVPLENQNVADSNLSASNLVVQGRVCLDESGVINETYQGVPQNLYLEMSSVGRQTSELGVNDKAVTTLKNRPTENNNNNSITNMSNANGPSMDSNVQDNENIQFLDENVGVTVGKSSTMDSSMKHDVRDSLDLGDFLKRPVRIGSFTTTMSDAVGTLRSYNAWHLFFNDSKIKYKLNNFAFVTCDLHVKIVLNSSPFYYGMILASYIPLVNLTPGRITNGVNNEELILHSQRPHAWMSIGESEGCEMILPFFSHKNKLNLQSASELSTFGTLNIINYTKLLSANGASTGNVTVSIYAWAENVKLSGPSEGLAVQGKVEKDDEYGKGPVSSVASAVAKAAHNLSRVPVIGPYATATEMGAKAIAAGATALGYTNVPVIDPPKPVRQMAVPSFSSSEIGFPLDKLNLDPKTELSIDPRTVGLDGVDELSIPYLVQKESFLSTFSWKSTDLPDDTLYSSFVSPMMYNIGAGANPALYMTPMCWLSQMFMHWRGDLIFTFRIVASAFHKGRLRISYDPAGTAAYNIVGSQDCTTSVFTKIIDLGKDNEVELRIPYMQPTSWLETLAANSANMQWGTGAITFASSGVATNGMFNIRALTALTGPTATNEVTVLVSVRGAPNLEFANPCPRYKNFSTFVVQGDVTPDTEVVAGETAPVDENRYLINFGECVVNLRSLLRRSSYNWGDTYTGAASSMNSVNYWRTRFPLVRGYQTSALWTYKGLVDTVTNYKYNMSTMHPISYVQTAFVGTKGSIIWHITADAATPGHTLKVCRIPQISATPAKATSTTLLSGVSLSGTMRDTNNSGEAGLSVSNSNLQGSLSYSVPNNTRFKFQSTRPENAHYAYTTDGTDRDCVSISIDTMSTTPVLIRAYCGIGTDYTVFHFLNVPTFWIESGTPLP